MLFQCDLNIECSMFNGEYCSILSSDDQYDQNLPFDKRRAKGGTMVMWKRKLNAYISRLPTSSSSILPILFTPPAIEASIHILIYLPTAGRDSAFLEEISCLYNLILELKSKYHGVPIHIRGDANINHKDTKRIEVFNKFCYDFNVKITQLNHKTYHHFTGDGISDSELDVLLQICGAKEELVDVICRKHDPAILSLHDIIFSCFQLSSMSSLNHSELTPMAPRVSNDRVKVYWSVEGSETYLKTVG